MDEFFKAGNIFLIVGATNDLSKYGGKVFKDLKEAGYGIIAVNNRVGGKEEIQGLPSYPSVTAFFDRVIEFFNEQQKQDAIAKIVLVLVIPPQAALEVLHEATDHGVRRAWFQPGAESDEALTYCKEQGVEVIHNQCIMVQKPKVN